MHASHHISHFNCLFLYSGFWDTELTKLEVTMKSMHALQYFIRLTIECESIVLVCLHIYIPRIIIKALIIVNQT